MGRGLYNDIDRDLAASAGLHMITLKAEQKTNAVLAVTGSDACRGAGDAKVILEAMGLYDFAVGMAEARRA